MYQRVIPWVVGGLRVFKPVVEKRGWKRIRSFCDMEDGTCWYVGIETDWWIEVGLFTS